MKKFIIVLLFAALSLFAFSTNTSAATVNEVLPETTLECVASPMDCYYYEYYYEECWEDAYGNEWTYWEYGAGVICFY